MTDPYRRTVSANVPTEVAWDAITDPAQVAEWFTSVTTLGSVGDPYVVDFGDATVRGVVQERGPRAFSYTWRWVADDGPTTVVQWTVAEGDGECLITLRHDGWPDDSDGRRMRDDHAGYWDDYLNRLRDYLEALHLAAAGSA